MNRAHIRELNRKIRKANRAWERASNGKAKEAARLKADRLRAELTRCQGTGSVGNHSHREKVRGSRVTVHITGIASFRRGLLKIT